jgi:hypothetical protein
MLPGVVGLPEKGGANGVGIFLTPFQHLSYTPSLSFPTALNGG